MSSSSIPPAPLPSALRAPEHVSPTKGKGKKRKRDDDDEAYQDRHDLAAQNLVQQVTYNTIPVKIMLMC